MTEFECIEPDTDEYADYASRFAQYNQDHSGWQMQTFSMVLRDKGCIIAGGRGHVYLGALEVRGLWVNDSLRGKRVGSGLLEAIEHEARNRGATKAMLYTYSWQAEGFYRRHGYTEFSRFDFPEGHYRVEMQKSL
ncbi:acetyltransferase (GNAT) family protein [Yoonia maricola]|uniref:Acetyltransferase (GNAT) family protein n=1 Tax=Yoonia maricola TaxID=420999 RepID=A0A2M8W2F3_9RHOB|nr:GNAT family N-acetyltransferase [Yoonia maricola]PJI85103.1 acetyltransferase (GNAT) family protein [Yoonia maricola]